MNFAAMAALLDEALRGIPHGTDAHKCVQDVRTALIPFTVLSDEVCLALAAAFVDEGYCDVFPPEVISSVE